MTSSEALNEINFLRTKDGSIKLKGTSLSKGIFSKITYIVTFLIFILIHYFFNDNFVKNQAVYQ